MRYLTSGESHGPQLTTIIEGLPSGMVFATDKINEQLSRRQKGYGRGRRMQIEVDEVEVLSGVRFNRTTGAPVTLVIKNNDWKHWKKIVGPEALEEEANKKKITKPRPGHADLNGAIKYNHEDVRDVLERSSARETATRVAVGAVARQFLEHCGVYIAGHVKSIGGIRAQLEETITLPTIQERSEKSRVRCLDKSAELQMIEKIDEAKRNGDSLGGVVEVIVEGVPIGLGSYVHWDRKLDAKIAQAIISIHAFKGVEFGMGFEAGVRRGSEVHDEIFWSKEIGFYRATNRSGGFEGGMSTGEPIVVRGIVKPIPTLYKPLQSVNIKTKEAFTASIERSDVCVVPAASVIAENVVAWEIAKAVMEKFPADTMNEMIFYTNEYRKRVREF